MPEREEFYQRVKRALSERPASTPEEGAASLMGWILLGQAIQSFLNEQSWRSIFRVDWDKGWENDEVQPDVTYRSIPEELDEIGRIYDQWGPRVDADGRWHNLKTRVHEEIEEGLTDARHEGRLEGIEEGILRVHDELMPHLQSQDRYYEGAAAAFGLIGMAEAINDWWREYTCLYCKEDLRDEGNSIACRRCWGIIVPSLNVGDAFERMRSSREPRVSWVDSIFRKLGLK